MTHPYKRDSEASAATKLGRIQKACGGSVGSYAHGGRTKKSGKTEVNIIVAPSDAGGMGAPGMEPPMGMPHPMPAPPPRPPMASMGAGAVPPQVAQALAAREALAARARMGGASGAGIPMRARGGRFKGGAGSGIGRLEKAAEFGNRK